MKNQLPKKRPSPKLQRMLEPYQEGDLPPISRHNRRSRLARLEKLVAQMQREGFL